MNGADRKRLKQAIDNVDALLSSGPSVNPTVRNIDVLEAFLYDVKLALNSRDSNELQKLIDIEENEK